VSVAPVKRSLFDSNLEPKVILAAAHSFGNFTQNINSSDKIWFRGVLKTSLNAQQQRCQSGDSILIELTAVGCVKCANKDVASINTKNKLKFASRVKDLQRALKYLLNVLFSPLLTFK